MKSRLVFFACLLIGLSSPLCGQGTWKAGTARVKITPEEPTWLAGYASRTKPSEGTMHDLWAKALVLQDARGNQSLLVTSDILGFPKAVSDRIREQLQKKFRLTKAQIILSSSHTHSGPVLENALVDIYPLDDEGNARVRRYTAWLEKQVLALADAAFKNLQPANLFSQNGVTRFQVNRRNNSENQLPELSELKGPSDYAVPVLKVQNTAGEIIAIVFGYACHPTVLGGYEWSGDYPGFAQIELEKTYPKATAMFFLGAAGDQNPLPRRTVPLARQYGKELAAAVERVLEEEMTPLSTQLGTAYVETDLKFAALPTEKELQKQVETTNGYLQRWASRMLEKVRKKEALMKSYPYPVQAWSVGGQLLFSLGGEVTVEYARKIKQMFGENVFVAAYTNDVMGYIPSLKVLREGGYEGYSSQMVYGLPAAWDIAIESTILNEVAKIGKQVAFPSP